ncbi:hypothetical protein HBI11_066450 [Parastagonospora nodorum]|nr:hypothetical protein HBH73_035740 [Parastagonospora nodorum]KAH5316148.1 hypothetical protein HBI11_066450 [Parastagonospora nodorum]
MSATPTEDSRYPTRASYAYGRVPQFLQRCNQHGFKEESVALKESGCSVSSIAGLELR